MTIQIGQTPSLFSSSAPVVVVDNKNSSTCHFIDYQGKSPCSVCNNRAGSKFGCSSGCKARLKYSSGIAWNKSDIPDISHVRQERKEETPYKIIVTKSMRNKLESAAKSRGHKSLVAEIIHRHDTLGHDFYDISKSYGVSQGTIRFWYFRAIRCQDRKKNARQQAVINRQRAVEMFKKGLKKKIICAELGISHPTVNKYIAESIPGLI